MRRRVAAVVEQCWHRVPGGTAIATVRTLNAIAAAGRWDVVGLAARHRERAPGEALVGLGVHQLPMPRLALYESWHRLRRPRPQRWAGPVEVVHATGGVVPPSGEAALVATIHDLAFVHRPDHFTPRGVKFMTRAFELVKAEAALVIVPSDATAADCRAEGLSADRLRVVPWGVEAVPVTKEAREAVRARHRLPPQFLLSVGTSEPRKNLARLVQAHQKSCRDLPLILVGPSGWGPEIGPILESAGGVRHLGEVSSADLVVLYDMAMALVYPSLLEGFGMPVLEAMGQGTPAITSRGTATEEVLGGGGILVDPTDVDQLAEAMERITGDDQLRADLASKARARAAEFSWSNTADLTSAVYDEAIAR